jgi:hypothetical protein
MEREKRRGEAPIPTGFQDALNLDQLMTLRQIENFGWQLAFVRRPLFQKHVVVVATSDSKKFGVLEDTGELNLQAEINIRKNSN